MQLLSCIWLFSTSGLQQARLPCSSLSLRVSSNSHPLHQWCHPTISSSVVPFSSCLQSFPKPESFPMSQPFVSGGPSIGASASASVLPMTDYSGLISCRIDWFTLRAVQGTLESSPVSHMCGYSINHNHLHPASIITRFGATNLASLGPSFLNLKM